MKNHFTVVSLLFLAMAVAQFASAQTGDLQYFRPLDQTGINIFEPSKTDDQPAFDGLKLRLGVSLSQDAQHLKHSNTPTYVPESETNPVNSNLLYGAGASGDSTSATLAGFNTAMANLYINAQLADGIRVCVESYMSSRHHPDFWVKGGYLQIDKLPMFGDPKWFSKYMRLKLGHYEPNYGDMHFRRSDAGNCIYNPFVENYIIDAYTTEIGGELSLFPFKGLTAVAGLTTGLMEGNVTPYSATAPPGFTDPIKKDPSLLFKLAFDGSNKDLRYRISGSYYSNSGSVANTMYLGDRAGSHYSMVMEQARSMIYVEGIPTGIGPSTTLNNKDSGRFLPLFTNQVSSVMVNPFVKYKGLEFFGAYEIIKGRMGFEAPGDRKFTQIAGELVFRFLPREQCYVAARYNTVKGTPLFMQNEITINRATFAAGWFPTRNIELKAEYVNQQYKDFPVYDYRYNGKFSGAVVEAVVGF
ncbi:MAG TPA: hypothetical protein VE978_27975 [Chitinophagales bacterium]|nr:hypothetical protein [Chitinophagales bacterium]